MFARVLVGTSIAAAAVGVSADVTASVEPYYEGFLSDGTTYVFSYDVTIEVTADDAWTYAGGAEFGDPWITIDPLDSGVFYQHPYNDGNPPDPALFPIYPDSVYTSCYTTPTGDEPVFFYGPDDTPTELVAGWGPAEPCATSGLIARFTVVPSDPTEWCARIDLEMCGPEGCVLFTWSADGCCPGDLDGDRDVDLCDLAQLLANFGLTSGATYWDGDLDGDDDVDIQDLGELLSEYGAICP